VGIKDHRTLKQKVEDGYIPEPTTGCWLWIGTVQGGRYGAIWHQGKFWAAHRVSYEIVHGPIPDGMKACHKCDTPMCVNPRHLFIGTQRDNVLDMFNKRRGNRCMGEKHLKAKITERQALDILDMSKQGQSRQEIVKKTGISWGIVSGLVLGTTWKHLKRP